MKPTFLLCGGVGWCATNPLRYTLADVCNVGKLREHHYLYYLSGEGNNKAMVKHCQTNDAKTSQPIRELLNSPVSIESYISYYKKLYDSTDIPIIADGSGCSNFMLSEEFLSNTIKKLSEHFDVRSYMIFRDPVRRAWSHLNFLYFRLEEKLERIKTDNRNISFNEFLNSKLNKDWSGQYIQTLEKFQRHVNTLPIVMEELWEGDTDAELELISTHIGERVDTLYENVFSPDRGVINASGKDGHPKYFDSNMPRYLRDQWSSDRLELTPDIYHQMKKVFQPTYDAWENKFGSLPKYWGRPYNYQ